jgi:hypothetical protein
MAEVDDALGFDGPESGRADIQSGDLSPQRYSTLASQGFSLDLSPSPQRLGAHLDAIEEFGADGADADDEAYTEAVLEILDEMALTDAAYGEDPYGAPPDSARLDLGIEMGRTALESILRNVTFVVSTRITGMFNTDFVPAVG